MSTIINELRTAVLFLLYHQGLRISLPPFGVAILILFTFAMLYLVAVLFDMLRSIRHKDCDDFCKLKIGIALIALVILPLLAPLAVNIEGPTPLDAIQVEVDINKDGDIVGHKVIAPFHKPHSLYTPTENGAKYYYYIDSMRIFRNEMATTSSPLDSLYSNTKKTNMRLFYSVVVKPDEEIYNKNPTAQRFFDAYHKDEYISIVRPVIEKSILDAFNQADHDNDLFAENIAKMAQSQAGKLLIKVGIRLYDFRIYMEKANTSKTFEPGISDEDRKKIEDLFFLYWLSHH